MHNNALMQINYKVSTTSFANLCGLLQGSTSNTKITVTKVSKTFHSTVIMCLFPLV